LDTARGGGGGIICLGGVLVDGSSTRGLGGGGGPGVALEPALERFGPVGTTSLANLPAFTVAGGTLNLGPGGAGGGDGVL
jgi:hypothetical protein